MSQRLAYAVATVTKATVDPCGTSWLIIYGTPGLTGLLAIKHGVAPSGWDRPTERAWWQAGLCPDEGFGQ